MADFDIHIKGGTIVDGTRVPRYRGDVWIRDGKVAQIGGRAPGFAKRTIDADGLIVAPGFVDLHTHYDAQIRWDPWCTISGWHGVTSVVLGNCGFGFVPVKPNFRERSMLTMTRTEAIPYASMKAGMKWDWETVPEYMDSLDRTPKGVNCIQYMPTASLMIYVMGLEAAKTRPANEEERAEMRRVLNEGMDAGLCGFSIQRFGVDSVQGDYDGTPMVTDTMTDEDILNLAQVLRERDEGFIQISQLNLEHPEKDLEFEEKLAAAAQRPVLHNLVGARMTDPTRHRGLLKWLKESRDKGLPVYGQGATLRASFAFTLEHWNLYDASPVWRKMTTGTKEEKIAKMRDPELRRAAEREIAEADRRLLLSQGLGGPIPGLIISYCNRQEELDKYIGKSVGQVAQEWGKSPVDTLLDLSILGDLNVEFYGPNPGFSSEYTAEVINNSPYTFAGVSDGGAHTKFFTGGCYTTDFLTWLVRDEQKVTLEEAHYRLSALPAHAAGFRNRGVLREGSAADVVVYDLKGLKVTPDWVGTIVNDFPGGEWRRVQYAEGYRAVIVNGQMTFDEGKCTGATPGKLLRGGRG
jgi:N-acyl-D-aspartate/D-glutamate deacylase